MMPRARALRSPLTRQFLLTLLFSLIVPVAVARAEEPPGVAAAAKQRVVEAPSAAAVKRLTDELDRLCVAGPLAQTRVGVHVVDLTTGQIIYARDATARYNPASNMKLVTAAAALDALGPAHTFTTTLRAGSAARGGVIGGDLYVSSDGAGLTRYEDVLGWAAELKAQGVTKIQGDIVVDDGPYQAASYVPPGFDQKQEDAAYRATAGPVSVDFNAVGLVVRPGAKAGDDAVVVLDPPNEHVRVVGSVKTVEGKAQRVVSESVSVEAGEGTELRMRGTIGVSAAVWSAKKRIDSPPRFAGAVLKGALEELGIEVTGNVRRGEKAYTGGVVLVSHSSEPLLSLIAVMNKWSNNFVAEQLFRALGRTQWAPAALQGGWEGSAAALLAYLKGQGIGDEEVRVKNGSGLYAGNAISPRGLTTLLVAMHHHRWGPEFKASLSLNGMDGSLRGRLVEQAGRVRGKTGTLNEVIALSGYFVTRGGRELAVAIVFNDPPVLAWRLRAEQDAIARAILEWDA